MLNPSLHFWYLAQSWTSSSICLSIYLSIYHDHHHHHQHLSIIYHLCVYYLSIIYHPSISHLLIFYQSFITYVLSIEEVRCGSRLVVSDALWPQGLVGLLCSWDSPGMNTGVGCHSLLQGIFLTQGSKLGLPHCSQILYHLSHQGSPSLFIYHLPIYLCMEWVTHSVDKWALSFTTVVSIYLATLCSSLKALLMYLLHAIILDFTAPVKISTPYSNCPSALLKGRWSGEWEEVACGDWWHLSSPPAPPLL